MIDTSIKTARTRLFATAWRSGSTDMKAPGPQNPGANQTIRNGRRSGYFFFAAFFLAAGFLAAFFLAAMMVYLLHVISDPMNGLRRSGPYAFMRKGLLARIGRSTL